MFPDGVCGLLAPLQSFYLRCCVVAQAVEKVPVCLSVCLSVHLRVKLKRRTVAGLETRMYRPSGSFFCGLTLTCWRMCTNYFFFVQVVSKGE